MLSRMAKRKSIAAMFEFHGSFERKSEAMAQERKIPGAFILPTDDGHYVVVTSKEKTPVAPSVVPAPSEVQLMDAKRPPKRPA